MATETLAVTVAIFGATVGLALTLTRQPVATRVARFLAVATVVAMAVAIGANHSTTLTVSARAVASAPSAFLRAVAVAPGLFYIGAYILAVFGLAVRSYLNR